MKNLVNTELKASVDLKRMYFKHIEFIRSDDDFDSVELKVNFNKSHQFNQDSSEAIVTLSCKVSDVDESLLSLDVTIVGVFRCHHDCEDVRRTLLSKNTVAILFPYLRSQISLITTQPDMPPITLPPINIEALLNNQDK